MVPDEEERASLVILLRDEAPSVANVVLDAVPDAPLAMVRNGQACERIVAVAQAAQDDPDAVVFLLRLPTFQVRFLQGFGERLMLEIHDPGRAAGCLDGGWRQGGSNGHDGTGDGCDSPHPKTLGTGTAIPEPAWSRAVASGEWSMSGEA